MHCKVLIARILLLLGIIYVFNYLKNDCRTDLKVLTYTSFFQTALKNNSDFSI